MEYSVIFLQRKKTYRQIGALCFRSNVVIWSYDRFSEALSILILRKLITFPLSRVQSLLHMPIIKSGCAVCHLDLRLLKSFIYRKVNTSSVVSKSELSAYSLCFSVTYSSSMYLQHVIIFFWQYQFWSDRHTSYLICSEMHFQSIHKCSPKHSVLRTHIKKIHTRESFTNQLKLNGPCVFYVSIYTMLKSLKRKTTRSFTVPCPGWRTSPYELYCSDIEIQLFTWRLVYFTSCHLIDIQVDRHSIRRLKLIHQVQLIHHQVQLSAFDLGKINRPSFDTSSIVFCRLILYVESVLYLLEYNFCWEERKSVTGRSLSNFSNFNDRFVVKSENINNSPPPVRVKRAPWPESDRPTLRYTSFWVILTTK